MESVIKSDAKQQLWIIYLAYDNTLFLHAIEIKKIGINDKEIRRLDAAFKGIHRIDNLQLQEAELQFNSAEACMN